MSLLAVIKKQTLSDVTHKFLRVVLMLSCGSSGYPGAGQNEWNELSLAVGWNLPQLPLLAILAVAWLKCHGD